MQSCCQSAQLLTGVLHLSEAMAEADSEPTGMKKVASEYPTWGRLRPMLPCEPCVFTSVSAVPVREYESALLRELQWPTYSTLSEKATCVRVMASQLCPLLTEYAQLRDHLQGYMAKLDVWLQSHLIPQMTRMEAMLESLSEDMHRLKLHDFVHGQAAIPRHPNSVAPSVASGQISVADSIAEAQVNAAAKRSQGPAMFFPIRGHEPGGMETGPNPRPIILGQQGGQEGNPSFTMRPNPELAPTVGMAIPLQVLPGTGCGQGQQYPSEEGNMPNSQQDVVGQEHGPRHDPIGLVLHHLTSTAPEANWMNEDPNPPGSSSRSPPMPSTSSVPKSPSEFTGRSHHGNT